MQVPLEMSFRNVPKHDWAKDMIHDMAGKLERVAAHISSCRVAVEQVQKHQKSGRPYRVRLDITVPPGHEIAVVKDQGRGHMHESLTDVLENAFHTAEGRLRKLRGKQQGRTKQHPLQQPNAIVSRVYRVQGYGFLRALDGHQIYFHRNSVRAGDFNRLRPRTGVHVVEEEGEQGMQAVAVRVVEPPSL